MKNYIFGILTVVTILLLVSGIKGLNRHTARVRQLEISNKEYTEQVDKLRKDTVEYRRQLKEYINSSDYSQWVKDNRLQELNNFSN